MPPRRKPPRATASTFDSVERETAPLRPHRSRIPKKGKYQVPGPGAYDTRPKGKLAKVPCIAFGNARRKDSLGLHRSPGPGAYSGAGEQSLSLTKKASTPHFGSSTRDSVNKMYAPGISTIPQDNPAPGSYSVKRRPDTPATSFGGKLSQIDRHKTGVAGVMLNQNVPGPGEYEVRPALDKVGTCTRRRPKGVASFGTAPRFRGKSINDDGPGLKYNGGKSASTMVKQSVGNLGSVRTFTFGGREKHPVALTKEGLIIRQPVDPGPSFDPEESKGKPPLASLNVLDSRTRRPPKFSFGTSKRFNTKVYQKGAPSTLEDSPGPCYDPQPVMGEAPAFAFSESNRANIYGKSDSPGPCAYNTVEAAQACERSAVHKSSPTVRFGTAKREQQDKLYDSFGSGGGDLNKAAVRPDGPGPGEYNPRPVQTAPAFSIRGRIEKKGKSLLLEHEASPAHYQQGFTMMGRLADSSKRSAGCVPFGSSTRDQCGKVFSPGMKNPTPSESNRTPGPGAYDRPAAIGGKQAVSVIRSASGARFNTAPRQPLQLEGRDSPGPGEYPVQPAVGRQRPSTKRTAPAHRFGTSERLGAFDTAG